MESVRSVENGAAQPPQPPPELSVRSRARLVAARIWQDTDPRKWFDASTFEQDEEGGESRSGPQCLSKRAADEAGSTILWESGADARSDIPVICLQICAHVACTEMR